jgi:hypothetical protein
MYCNHPSRIKDALSFIAHSTVVLSAVNLGWIIPVQKGTRMLYNLLLIQQSIWAIRMILFIPAFQSGHTYVYRICMIDSIDQL